MFIFIVMKVRKNIHHLVLRINWFEINHIFTFAVIEIAFFVFSNYFFSVFFLLSGEISNEYYTPMHMSYR